MLLAATELVMHAPQRTLALAQLDALRIDGELECEFSSVVPGACLYRIEIR